MEGSSSNKDLEERYNKEEVFHDEKYSGENNDPKHYSVNPTFKIFKRMMELIGDIENKRILEYGCGDGWMTAELAAQGAHIDAFDISGEAVKCTESLLKKNNLDQRVQVKKMGAEKLEYENDSFDIVFGFAILHHLDLEKAIPELFRVLKPGGYAIFAEPLEGNPGLRLYRALTPQYRTVDEEPIVLSSFPKKISQFQSFQHEEFYLTALVAFVLIYLPGCTRFFEPVVKPLMSLDKFLLKKFPMLANWAWYSIFVFHK